MYILVKDLATAIGKSTRLIQLKIKSGEIKARKINAKSYEVEVASLPLEWQEKAKAKITTSIANITPRNANLPTERSESSNALNNIIGRPLNVKEKEAFNISNYYKNLPAMLSEKNKVTATASYFGKSPTTIRRIIKKVESGIAIQGSNTRRNHAWDIEAEQYIKAYYLQLLKDRNIDCKMSAYQAVQKQAEICGWKIGSQATAYRILGSISNLLIQYATGGNRALDNYFYIKRDWSSLKPAQMLVGDQHICDFWVKENVEGKERYYRPTFYVWEDCATRCIAGLAVDKNYDSGTVIQALYMAVCRFGFFSYTYNDNGTAECSKAATQVIDELIALSNGQTQMMDISELYKLRDGSYAIMDGEDNIIDTAPDLQSFRSKRKRIYAQVKNAKTKPIERLFSTLEMEMSKMGVAGHVVTPGAPADQEEKESMILERQKRNGEILTLDEFVTKFVEAIDRYENTIHSSLKMTPMQCLNKHIASGWKAKLPDNMADLDFIFMNRKQVKVNKARVLINNIMFEGEDILPDSKGELQDLGLALHEGEKIEVRWFSDDLTRAYAVIPGSKNPIRALTPVESIEMFDNEAMQRMLSWKRHNMKVVRDAFKHVAYPESVTKKSLIGKQLEETNKRIEQIEEITAEEKKKQLLLLEENRKEKKKVIPFFREDSDRFKYCLDCLIEGEDLSQLDKDFMQDYKKSDAYKEEEKYWETYKRYGGLK